VLSFSQAGVPRDIKKYFNGFLRKKCGPDGINKSMYEEMVRLLVELSGRQLPTKPELYQEHDLGSGEV
jgi:hypothetical protein